MALNPSWKPLLVLCTVSFGSLMSPQAAMADFITDWNNQELTQIRNASMDPLYASRDLAILQVTMFDAVNGVDRQDNGIYVTQNAPAGTSMGATIAAVGLRVMSVLYGSNSVFTTLYNSEIASLADSPTAISQGIAWGTSVANTILNFRATDGASTSNPAYSASGEQGEWTPTPPAFGTQPLRPGWVDVIPFALNTGSQFRPNGPPSLDAAAYVTDFNQVKTLGQDVSSTRTTDNTDAAVFWNDPAGTVTTSGHWNQAVQALSSGFTVNERAKLFAAVNITMADAAIAAWDAKFTYKNWRPVSAIRDEATRDTGVSYDNPGLTGDAAWTPLFATPVSPEYVSLTSALSHAAATTLANLLGGDLHAFSINADTDGDGTDDMTRTYSSFSQASLEAGKAGIFGGNQFITSVQDGHTLGGNVAQYVTDNYFTPIVTTPDNGASLFSLTLSAGTLSPVFASATISYTETVSNATTSVTVTPTVTQPQATIEVNGVAVASGTASGAISLDPGSNLITVLVTSGDGIATRTYTIDVIRATAPTVTTLAGTNVTGSGATLNGTVNANQFGTTVTFDYGFTTGYGSSATAVQSPITGGADTLARAPLSGLAPGATYHYRIRGVNAGGTSLGTDATFATPNTVATLSSLLLSAGTLSPVFASATTDYTATVSNTTASITIGPTVTQFQATVSVNGTAVSSGTASGAISIDMGSNLITVLVTAQDGTATKTYTINVTRTILPPTVTTLAASGVTSVGATLNGTVNANDFSTVAAFDYGLTAAYGGSVAAAQSPIAGHGATAVSAALTGLSQGTLYHYRARGVNSGGTTLGDDAIFTIPSTIATLSGLTLNGVALSPSFASATTSYTAAVSNATASITVTPTVTQPQATVAVNGTAVSSGTASGAIALNVGSNVITGLVTAQDGSTTRSYSININRAPPAPEIVVEQPLGTSLVDGAAIASFGNVNIGSTPGSLTFTIKNTGTADLTSLAIAKNGANAAEFTVGLPGATTLPPNASTTFSVTFTPSGAGARTAAIHIASNDADENPFDINLGGIGVLTPEIVVEQPAGTNLVDGSAIVNFGNTPTGAPSSKVFTIKNTGLGSLTGLGITFDGANAADFSVTADPTAPLAAGTSTTFAVRFAPATVGPRTASLHIASSDADKSSFDIALQGNGTPSPGVLAFDGTGFTVIETAGTVTIPIKRTGGSSGTVTVNVSTTNGTALAPGDYTAITNVPVTFTDGVVSGSTTVSIVNTAAAKVNQTFKVTLSSPTGGATLGTPGSAPVTIIDSTSLSNVTDTAVPSSPVISAPLASAVVSANTGGIVSVAGTAADNKGVKQVRLSLNGGVFADAVLGTPGAPSTTFTFPLNAVSGLNTIQVKSTDYANRESSIVTRSFTVTRPLAVIADSTLGSVTAGFSPSSFRRAGQSLSITATPKPPTTTPAFSGALFIGWNLGGTDVAGGGIPFTPQRLGIAASALEKPTLNFIFREGLVLTANFMANPYAIMAGTYNGLIRASCILPDRAPAGPGPEDGTTRTNSTEGLFTATVTNTGAFSGKLAIDGSALNVAGAFDQNGIARFGTARALTLAVARTNKPSLVVALQIDLVTPGTGDKIIGSVSVTGFQRSATAAVSTVDADRAFFNGTTQIVPAAYLAAANANGIFTTVFPCKDVNDQTAGFTTQDYPQGDGVGAITVTKAGVITVTGTLADGTAVSASSALSQTMTFPLFVSLYKNRGCLGGQVALDNTQVVSDMAATDLEWLKPSDNTSHYYPYGWPEVIKVDLMAAKYAAVTGQSALKAPDGPDDGFDGDNLQAADGDGNITLTFSDGQLSETVTKSANVSTADILTTVPATDRSFKATITRSTGAISGTFTHTDDTVPTFQGIIYQKGPNAGAYGFFLTKQPVPIDYTGESGGLSIVGQP